MNTTRFWGWFGAFAVGFALLSGPISTAAPVPAASEEQLKEAALKLNQLTSPDAMQTKLSELIKDKDYAAKLLATATKMQKDAKGKEPPFKFGAALILAKVAHSSKQFDTAEVFYEVCAENATKLQSGPRMLQAYEGLMDLYWEQKKFKSLEEVCQKLMESRGPEIKKAQPFILEKLVQAKAKQGDVDEALRMAESLAQLDKEGWYFLQLKGWVQREAMKYDDAIESYTEVIERLEKIVKDQEDEDNKKQLKTIQKNVRYLMSGIYVDNNDIDKAAKGLQALIKDDPENPTYYNDLGFIWCDNDKNLEESEKMIRKALDLDAAMRKKLLEEGKIDAATAKQENAAYLDSLGWVLYKQKKYDEAKKYLELATKDDDEGAHIEIWDHLADCLVAMGKRKEAIEIWQKSLKFEDISKRDSERRKKITAKLTKAKAELDKDK